MLEPRYKCKHEGDMFGLALIHPMLLFIFADLSLYCNELDIPVVITRVIGEKIPDISTSDTHSEGRAIDISVRNWAEEDIKAVEKYINDKYAEDYGTSRTGKNPIVFLDHVGTARHIHLQVRRGITPPYRS